MASVRTPEQLAALAAKPEHHRTSAEKKALRNQRCYANSKKRKLLGGTAATGHVLPSVAAGAAEAVAAASSLALAPAASPTAPLAAIPRSAEDARTKLLVLSHELPLAPLSDALLAPVAAVERSTPLPTVAVAAAATAASVSAVTSASIVIDVSLDDDKLYVQPCLVACALRFASTLLSKQQRCLPFTFDAAKRSALQAAVEQRVCDDWKDGERTSAPSDAATMTGALAAQTETATKTLCERDRQLLHSCLTMLLHWPHWMQQQWRAVGSRKIAKSEVSSALRDQHTIASPACTSVHSRVCALCPTAQISQLHEQAALYDYIREVALRHNPPLGYAVSNSVSSPT